MDENEKKIMLAERRREYDKSLLLRYLKGNESESKSQLIAGNVISHL